MMTVNRASAISVLGVQLKVIYSASWCRLVSIRETNQKLIILILTLTIDQLKLKHCNWLFCANSACRQAKKEDNFNYLDFFTGNVLFL